MPPELAFWGAKFAIRGNWYGGWKPQPAVTTRVEWPRYILAHFNFIIEKQFDDNLRRNGLCIIALADFVPSNSTLERQALDMEKIQVQREIHETLLAFTRTQVFGCSGKQSMIRCC